MWAFTQVCSNKDASEGRSVRFVRFAGLLDLSNVFICQISGFPSLKKKCVADGTTER